MFAVAGAWIASKLAGLSIRAIIIGLLLTAVVVFTGSLVLQNRALREDNKTLELNQQKLMQAINIQEETIAEHRRAISEWKESAVEMQRNLTRLSAVQKESRRQLDALEDKYAEHDLKALSLRKPKLVEGIINRGTADVVRMFNSAAN